MRLNRWPLGWLSDCLLSCPAWLEPPALHVGGTKENRRACTHTALVQYVLSDVVWSPVGMYATRSTKILSSSGLLPLRSTALRVDYPGVHHSERNYKNTTTKNTFYFMYICTLMRLHQ
jgi:hypothetical protein